MEERKTYVKSTRSRRILKLFVTVLVIIVAAILALLNHDKVMAWIKHDKKVRVTQEYLDNLEQEYAFYQSQSETYFKAADSLQEELTTCQNSLQVSNDSVVLLKDQLNKCKGVKKPVAKKPTTIKKKVAVPKKPANTDLVSKNDFKPAANTKSASTYKTSLEGAKFIGLKDGDFYITISADNYLQYVFAKRLYDQAEGTGVPELNDKGSGKKFELVGDAYVYTDKAAPINVANLSRIYHWSVYIGEKDGYSAYLPHELIKPEIIKARGELSGTISQEDVDKIGELVPEVKADRIQPNKITGQGAYDGLTYEGWRFCTKIMYKQE